MTRIDLSKFTSEGGSILSGRDRGEAVRKDLALEQLETKGTVELFLPSSIAVVNSSFFLVLIGSSVQKLGREEFRRRYNLIAGALVSERFNQAIERVLLTTSPL